MAPATSPPTATAVPAGGTPSRRTGRTRRTTALLLSCAVLAVAVLASLAVGSRDVPLGTVLEALRGTSDSQDALVVRELRVPRTLLGIAVGAALGLAGALMQALTRNPLADPGLLGVNSGAAAAMVTAVGVFGLTSRLSVVWAALLGAAVVSVAVYVLGSAGRGGATPVRLALAGTAVSAALTAYTTAQVLLDQSTFDRFRFWQVGSLTGHDMDVFWQMLPFFAVGIALALSQARSLNALALGVDSGRALGVRVGRTRVVTALAVTLLCGAATAAAGPIWFLGLAVPHVVRALTGPDQRWVLPLSVLLAPALLLLGDVLGRVVVRPGELEVSIVTALLGAPVLIALVRRRRLAQL
ncbi:iron chelate uptake ABC transporter family permease subunit [Paenibacillus sp. TRM 82003]|uniref:FecCD family ABC transporter permease n=1 Tax=Kineococcus sp. TRM81007 TaxID=2925831 RepID=UPI001F579B61|nr:iron chelate uptake ABC transporter family permease subunit [Kineococcus sp. TRM81007]MCI2239275.1 iron chelate uptake ABC transporter family permease subunit [Kineococcus sp. TRM81007]MCI3924957.1 iron chelate uptake ABC transporter family permease subunit [Paenibacillus sp. TRM 82003]